MSIKRKITSWLLPPAFYEIIRGKTQKKKDINEFITPVQLRHIKRYEFAKLYINGGRILDSACGSGYGSDLISDYDEYIGIDYADYCIKFALENYTDNNRRFINGDIYNLNEIFDKNSFDAIISFETLEHIDRPEIAIQVFMNLLKSGGKLITSIPINHPDRIYHKRIYNHNDIMNLVDTLNPEIVKSIEEYHQQHLVLTKLNNLLPNDALGTWIGVITKR